MTFTTLLFVHSHQRLEGGLFNLQQVSLILAYGCVFDRTCLKKAELRLGSEDASIEEVLDTLRDMLVTLHSADATDTTDADGSEQKGGADKAVEGEVKKVVTEWCAALAALVEQDK